ncbi:MAG: CPBP family intramembrane metalloprotease [Ruminococcus sp.]|nr:CPBP family intramembrane metalloprotease [Ruminococcus sp.]
MNNNRLYNYNYSPLDSQKEYEIKKLRKTSNGLGLFVFSYFIIMIVVTYSLVAVLTIISPRTNLLKESTPMFLLDIFISAFAAFIPSLFYFLFSGTSISDTIKVKCVKLKLLIPIVFLGLGVAMFANTVSNIIANNFSIFGLENSVDFSQTTDSMLEKVLYVIAVSLVPALAEEFAFRGVVMGTLRKYGDSFAIISSAVLFGLMHGNISQIPFAFILGLIFAFVDCKTNSILPSIIIHFLNNFYAVMMDIFQESYAISNKRFYIIYLLLVAILCILGTISFFILLKNDKKFFSFNSNTGVTYTKNDLLSFKDKNKTFYISFGVLLCIILFAIETVTNLGIIDV